MCPDTSNSLSIQIRRILSILLAILLIIRRQELICKRKGNHEPLESDITIFMRDDSINTINTECEVCGCALQLDHDDTDHDIFWVREI